MQQSAILVTFNIEIWKSNISVTELFVIKVHCFLSKILQTFLQFYINFISRLERNNIRNWNKSMFKTYWVESKGAMNFFNLIAHYFFERIYIENFINK